MTALPYTPATRADLKPGAVFVLRERHDEDPEVGTRLVLARDDGSEVLRFKRADGNRLRTEASDGARWFALRRLSLEAPAAPATLAIPRDVLEGFVATHHPVGLGIPNEPYGDARAALHAAITAAIAAADEQAEVKAARDLLAKHGYSVTRNAP